MRRRTFVLLAAGQALGVMLGNGWYNAHTRCNWNYDYAAWRDLPKLLLLLRVEFIGRPPLILASDASWRASPGPLVFDGLRNGEVYEEKEFVVLEAAINTEVWWETFTLEQMGVPLDALVIDQRNPTLNRSFSKGSCTD